MSLWGTHLVAPPVELIFLVVWFFFLIKSYKTLSKIKLKNYREGTAPSESLDHSHPHKHDNVLTTNIFNFNFQNKILSIQIVYYVF